MNTIALRKAVEKDAKTILDWRNDPQARASSAFSEKIQWGNHLAWFEKKIADSNTLIFMASLGGEDVGMMRVDIEGNGEKGVVSINVSPRFRGKGVGSKMLAELVGYCRKSAALKTLVADVLPSNPASLSLFSAAGFAKVGSVNINGKDFTRFELRL